jgi:5-bromo-4-chloroindolyl phosphate hydrolysis protein
MQVCQVWLVFPQKKILETNEVTSSDVIFWRCHLQKARKCDQEVKNIAKAIYKTKKSTTGINLEKKNDNYHAVPIVSRKIKNRNDNIAPQNKFFHTKPPSRKE